MSVLGSVEFAGSEGSRDVGQVDVDAVGGEPLLDLRGFAAAQDGGGVFDGTALAAAFGRQRGEFVGCDFLRRVLGGRGAVGTDTGEGLARVGDALTYRDGESGAGLGEGEDPAQQPEAGQGRV